MAPTRSPTNAGGVRHCQLCLAPWARSKNAAGKPVSSSEWRSSEKALHSLMPRMASIVVEGAASRCSASPLPFQATCVAIYRRPGGLSGKRCRSSLLCNGESPERDARLREPRMSSTAITQMGLPCFVSPIAAELLVAGYPLDSPSPLSDSRLCSSGEVNRTSRSIA